MMCVIEILIWDNASVFQKKIGKMYTFLWTQGYRLCFLGNHVFLITFSQKIDLKRIH